MQQAFSFRDHYHPATNEDLLPVVGYDFPSVEPFLGLALIGEAPGAEEVKHGHPFVGRSGQLLDKILLEAGINRRQCLVANVFRRQPPGNKIDHFFLSKRAAKESGVAIAENLGAFSGKYCKSNFALEIAYLQETLKKVRPQVILALGRTPLWALTGENGLLDKVGHPREGRLLDGVPVIPTFHPSFILRGNWGLQSAWLSHLAVAKNHLS
jgi:DNA polymerase